ncbi:expressed unknown protein [Seminavis robusta]|uniref:Glycosyltransferase family 92 protein n=1 Tax=Seminavis robusta TaxID=568900 RepID=A0A9N8D7W2_9STRA|nr:expressed unknown protein [Seminavis robusta]|eukprot:Sro30_g019750.1 n/a (570) ;mRNA; f:119046-120908
MLKALNRALQYGDKGKFKRPTKVRMGWMFPLLAIVSLFMNGSMHFRRTRGVSEIERGPPATKTPTDRIIIDDKSKETVRKSKLSETIRRQIEDSTYSIAKGATNSKPKVRRKKKPKTPPQANVEALRVAVDVLKKQKEASPQTSSQQEESEPVADNKQQPIADQQQPQEDKQVVKEEVKEVSSALETAEVVKKTTDMGFKRTKAKRRKAKLRKVTPAALSPNVTFSACLLVRDDNDIINEWIAYHYHTLRMRRLIVATDPNSDTSPSDVLDSWKGLMEIDVWSDKDYMPKEFLETGKPPKKEVKEITKFGEISEDDHLAINSHRYRQRVFLTECLKKVKAEKRSWAMHIDTDEYIVPNQFLREQDSRGLAIKPAEEPGSVLNMIQQIVNKNATNVAYPCITMLRVLFGSIETKETDWNVPMPEEYERKSFETFRWRNHGNPLNKKLHGHPKVLVDMSRVPRKYLTKDIVYSIHRPFQTICRGQGESDYGDFNKYPITANHYLGSWDRYNARNDARRSRELYDEKARVNSGQDQWVEGWLDGFIKNVGKKRAARLLGSRYLKDSDKKAKA